MSGGQKGFSALFELPVLMLGLGLVLALSLLSNFGLLSCSEPTPEEVGQRIAAEFANDCSQADADRRAGEDDYNKTILTDPNCVRHLMATYATQEAEQRRQLQEANEELVQAGETEEAQS